jgi:hypothetical protein
MIKAEACAALITHEWQKQDFPVPTWRETYQQDLATYHEIVYESQIGKSLPDVLEAHGVSCDIEWFRLALRMYVDFKVKAHPIGHHMK